MNLNPKKPDGVAGTTEAELKREGGREVEIVAFRIMYRCRYL